MYESLLQSSFLVRLLVSVIPALLVVIPLAYIAQKQEVVNRDDDNVMTTAMRFVGAAFIFIGSFANVTAWQGASSANSSLKNELASLSALSETILDYKQNDTLKDALSKITTYVQTISETELSKTGIKGFTVDNSTLQRKQRVKNTALNAPVEIKRDSAEQQALDYIHNLSDAESPRYVLTCDFQKFRLLDLESPKGDDVTEFELEQLPLRAELLGFLAGYHVRSFGDFEQQEASVRAAKIMGNLYETLELSGYSEHDSSIFLVRTLFALYADDSGMWQR